MLKSGGRSVVGSREASAPARNFTGPGTASVSSASSTANDPKLLLVDFRSGESVRKHPDVLPLLTQGWRIKSAVPRLVESKGTKLLVVLTPPVSSWREHNLA